MIGTASDRRTPCPYPPGEYTCGSPGDPQGPYVMRPRQATLAPGENAATPDSEGRLRRQMNGPVPLQAECAPLSS